MKIVIAMDSFKTTLTASEACRIVAKAIKDLLPDVHVSIKPMADGGEGTAEALMNSMPGRWIPKTVTGPLPNSKAEARFAWFENSRTAVVEMASASGLQLLAQDQYNPMITTTCGTGELIKAALEHKPNKILLAVGGSATVDGGIGAATALGWRFLDEDGSPVMPGGRGLERIIEIVEPEVPISVPVEVLCDVTNPLCGSHGAAAVYGPQKGATNKMVEQLDAGLTHLAAMVRTKLSREIADLPGAGAAGGLAGGAVAFMNAQLTSGVRTIMDFINLGPELSDADWVVTGEGCFDHQSLCGKVVSGVVEIAAVSGTAVAVIAGDVKLSEKQYQRAGIRTAIACKPGHISLDKALNRSAALLRVATQRFAKQSLI
jgi:glycerate kinase